MQLFPTVHGQLKSQVGLAPREEVGSDYICVALPTLTLVDPARFVVSVKPQSHRIVRFMDRTIGCDWAMVRPIGNACYDIQQRLHTAIDL